MKDFEEIVKIGVESKKTGVIYIGGGVSKDFYTTNSSSTKIC